MKAENIMKCRGTHMKIDIDDLSTELGCFDELKWRVGLMHIARLISLHVWSPFQNKQTHYEQ